MTITLDGREVTASPGRTVLEVARDHGVYIPTLCDDPALKPVGVCRVCLVEDEKSGAVLASCVTPAAAGMQISTSSDRVLAARRSVVELLMASHPDWCPVCDSANRCDLRRVAGELGVGAIRLERLHHTQPIEDANPYIQRDLTKCILCGKCIRACRDVHGVGAVEYAYRGFDSLPEAPLNVPLEDSSCNFCGLCMNLCPVAALAPKDGRARSFKADERARSVCPWCACGCALFVETRRGALVGVIPDYGSTTPRSGLCVKGQFGYEYLTSPERLTQPMIRRDGKLEKVSWDEALDFVAGRLREIRERHGGAAIGVLGASKCTNEENYALQKFARAVLGTNSIDNSAGMCLAPALAALDDVLGVVATTGRFADLAECGAVVLVGCDPTASHPVAGQKIKQAVAEHGAKLIVIDPRRTEMARWASRWLAVRPGTDLMLINSLAHILVADGIHDEGPVSQAAGWPEYERSLKDYAPKMVEATTGVPAELIRATAEEIGASKPVAVVFSSGVTQQPSGTELVHALAGLAVLSGTVDPAGGGLFVLGGQNNAHGACEMGALPDRLPGFVPVSDKVARARFAKAWGRQVPEEPGLAALDMVQAAAGGDLKAMLVFGENPARSLPGGEALTKALQGLQLLVVTDVFLSETGELADVVLPSTALAEKSGTVTTADRTVRHLEKALGAPGESRADLEIIGGLASRLTERWGPAEPSALFDEMAGLVSPYSGLSHDRLRSEPIAWPHPELSVRMRRAEPAAVPVTDEEFPVLLVTGRVLDSFGTGDMARHSPMLAAGRYGVAARAGRQAQAGPEAEAAPAEGGYASLEINPRQAAGFDVGAGDLVDVVSESGRVTARVRLSGSVAEGQAFMVISGALGEVNKLLSGSYDPRVVRSVPKVVAVRIEPGSKVRRKSSAAKVK